MKLGTNYPWAKTIQASSNTGPGPFQRVDTYKNLKKNVLGSLKNLLLKNYWPRKAEICMEAF
jgi:hypothetical protein